MSPLLNPVYPKLSRRTIYVLIMVVQVHNRHITDAIFHFCRVAVRRNIKMLTNETSRPPDWYSTKNCALQYARLLERVDTPKRKRERGDGANETPGEIVTKMLSKRESPCSFPHLFWVLIFMSCYCYCHHYH